MKYLLPFFFFTLIALGCIQAQSFEKTFPPQSYIYKSFIDKENSIVSIGSIDSASVRKIWLEKTDIFGERVSKTFLTKDQSIEAAFTIENTLDDGYIVGGRKGLQDTSRALLIRTNNKGDIIWKKQYGLGEIWSIRVLPDSSFLVGGIYLNNPSLWHIDKNGVIIYSNIYYISDQKSVVNKIIQNSDGSFLLFGRISSHSTYDGFFTIKVNSEGEKLASHIIKYGAVCSSNEFLLNHHYDDQIPYPVGIIETNDKRILIADYDRIYYKTTLYELNREGALIGETSIGNNALPYFPASIAEDAQGNFYIAGHRIGNDKKSHSKLLIKVSKNFSPLWIRDFGVGGYSTFTDVLCRDEHTLLLSGMHADAERTTYSGYLGKFYSTGFIDDKFIDMSLYEDLNDNCVKDDNDPPLKGWKIKLKGTDNNVVYNTNEFGQIITHINVGHYELTFENENSKVFEYCNLVNQLDILDTSPGTTELVFLVKKRKSCVDLSVSLTNNDILPCQQNIVYVEVKNTGNEASTDTKIILQADPALTINGSDKIFTFQDDSYHFDLESVPAHSSVKFYIISTLKCDVFPGEAFCIKASIDNYTDCNIENWEGPRLTTEAKCVNNSIVFSIKNDGNSDMVLPTEYRIISDGYTVITDNILLNTGQSIELPFNNKGNFARIEVDQILGYTFPDKKAISNLEGCGSGSSGFYSTGFINLSEHEEKRQDIAYACLQSKPFVDTEHVINIPKGYGMYTLIKIDEPIEYCINFQNKTNAEVGKIEIQFFVPAQMDPFSFELEAGSHNFEVQHRELGYISLICKDANLPNATLDSIFSKGAVRFKLLPITGFNKWEPVVMDAQIFFDDKPQPVLLYASNHYLKKEDWNYKDLAPVSPDESIKIFGGSDIEHAMNVIENGDGSLFIPFSSKSYSVKYALSLVKTDNKGKGIWQKTYAEKDKTNYFSSACSDGNNGLIVAGYQAEEILGNIFTINTLSLIRLDRDGNLVWKFSAHPRPNVTKTIPSKIIETSDGNFAIIGTCYVDNSKYYNFIYKIDRDGKEIFFKYGYKNPFESLNNFYETAEDGFVAIGTKGFNFAIFSADKAGKELSNHSFDFDLINDFMDFIPVQDGNLLMFSHESLDRKPVLIKLNTTGDLIWKKYLPDTLTLLSPRFGKTKELNKVILSGMGFTHGGTKGAIPFMKIDIDGTIELNEFYNVNDVVEAVDVQCLSDGRIAIAAETRATNYLYNTQTIILIVNNDGSLNNKKLYTIGPGSRFFIFPNPSIGILTVNSLDKNINRVNWKLTDILGRVTDYGKSDVFPFEIHSERLPGTYYLELESGGFKDVIPVVIR